jgi:hypothetical protein
MNEQELCVFPVSADQTSRPAGATERPLRICVVFDDDDSAQSAEVLIRQAASDYECDTQSFRFDDLDRPAPVIAAARNASNADILVLTFRDDQMLPSHVKSWLGLCLGLRDEDHEGALVVLIAEAAQTSNPGSSLLEYLEAIAVIGRLEFFSKHRGIDDHLNPARNHLELEDKLCGSFD